MKKEKAGRNDPCPCGSGKKFKKCCESSMLGGRFMASKMESVSLPNMSRLTGLFQSKVTNIAKPSEENESLKPPVSPEKTPDSEGSSENSDKGIES